MIRISTCPSRLAPWASAMAIAAALWPVPGAASPPAATTARGWVASWATSPQPLEDPSLAFENVTLREIVHLTSGGRAVRVRLDNTFGDSAVTFGDVHVGVQAAGGAIQPGTDRAVTFGGEASVTVAQGAQALSDPVDLAVPAQADLAISLYLPGAALATGHHDALQSSSVSSAGDHAADASAAAFTPRLSDWFWLAGVDVLDPAIRGAVVALGDSITNGAASPFNQNGRWPDVLARRLLALRRDQQRSVVNAGIDGNKLLLFRDCCGNSIPGLARLDRDVIAQAGATHVLVLLGTNDIADNGDPDAFIAGYRQMATQLHARGLTVIGATIPPWGGFDNTPQHEANRQRVNHWLRTTRALDGVVDFDRVLADPAMPTRLLPAFDSGDHLHPGPAGYAAMGNAIDLSLFAEPRRDAREAP
jgi:lysophospholipase L1-like esterase